MWIVWIISVLIFFHLNVNGLRFFVIKTMEIIYSDKSLYDRCLTCKRMWTRELACIKEERSHKFLCLLCNGLILTKCFHNFFPGLFEETFGAKWWVYDPSWWLVWKSLMSSLSGRDSKPLFAVCVCVCFGIFKTKTELIKWKTDPCLSTVLISVCWRLRKCMLLLQLLMVAIELTALFLFWFEPFLVFVSFFLKVLRQTRH